jgi:predicted Rossmann fold flavoprotein
VNTPGIVILGAGPAGLMAAIAARGAGASVIVCEQLAGPGARLLVTGGGHCNLTNTASRDDFLAAFGRQGRFISPAMEAMGHDQLRSFLHGIGLPTACPDGFHVFPESNRAADVLAALNRECGRLGVSFRFDARVAELQLLHGRVVGVRTDSGEILPARAVIVATGGASYPELGGTGGGYALARQAGHNLVNPSPGLVALVTQEGWPDSCAGVSIPNARVWIDLPRRRGQRTTGELLFTQTGISGPAVLDLSATVTDLLADKPGVELGLSFRGDVTADEWLRRFEQWRREEGGRSIRTLLARDLPRAVADMICRVAMNVGAGELGFYRAAELTADQAKALAGVLSAARLTVIGSAGFAKAMVTRGGVALKQVDPNTLESRLARGLYFAGEVLDLDGPCGGYNLQWAFASGWLAGSAAGKNLDEQAP